MPTKPELFEPSNALAVQQPQAIEHRPSLIQYAIDKGAGIDVIERLMALKEREDATVARKAYDAAMARFKANPPQILKTRTANAGSYTYKYADLADVTLAVMHGLSEVGISHRFERREQTADSITVACILRHELGHSEETVLSGPIDKSGGKQPLQMVGSTITYLQRYTLLMAVGLAAGLDTDGKPPVDPAKQMRPDVFDEWMDEIKGSSSQDDLQKRYFAALEAARKIGDKAAESKFSEAKNTWFKTHPKVGAR